MKQLKLKFDRNYYIRYLHYRFDIMETLKDDGLYVYVHNNGSYDWLNYRLATAFSNREDAIKFLRNKVGFNYKE